MLFASATRRRPRASALSNPETLESRALLSAANVLSAASLSAENGAALEPAFVAHVETVGRQAVPRIFVADDNYSLSSNTLGNGSLVITQEGNQIHGVFTAAKVNFATFDATFKTEKSKVAKGTLTASFIGDDEIVQTKYRIKFKVQDGVTYYTYNKLRFRPVAS